jgi:hypothetical protein
MEQHLWKAIDPQVDDLARVLHNFARSKQYQEISQILSTISKSLVGDRYAVEFTFRLDVCDDERRQALTLIDEGMSASEGRVRPTRDTCASQEVIIGDECHVVPFNQCPKCWAMWWLKTKEPSCPECSAQLGIDFQLFLKSCVCPGCGMGMISRNDLSCSECDLSLDPAWVVWG